MGILLLNEIRFNQISSAKLEKIVASNNFLLQLKGNKIETTKRRTLLDKKERVFGAF